MIRKLFLMLAFLASISATSLHAFDEKCCYSDYCCDALGTGFLIGAYGAFDIFHSENHTFIQEEEEEFILPSAQYSTSQRAPGGGGFIGYGFCFCDRFVNAFKAAITGYSSSTQNSNFPRLSGADIPTANELRLNYIIDLTWEPGTLIGDCLLMYFKFGGSYASVGQTLTLIRAESVPSAILKDKQSHHPWGFVFGVGANASISRCISAFTEYVLHSYPFSGSATVNLFTGDNNHFTSRITRLYGSGFRAGLMYQF